MRFKYCLLVYLCSFLFSALANAEGENASKAELLPVSVPASEPPFILVRPGLSVHKDIFVMPVTWAQDYNGNETEVVFQLSAKVKLFGTNAFFAFTQKSFWQAYNKKRSSPFRETNYNPEVFYRFTPDQVGIKRLGFDVGAEHESNGQVVPVSRSWNRFYLAPFWQRSNDLFYFKFWYRVPESRKSSQFETDGDDNPDLLDFTGRSEFHYRARLVDGSHLHFLVRANPSTQRGAVSFSYNMASDSAGMFYRVSLFSGYGESLIDYNRSVSRVMLGVSFLR